MAVYMASPLMIPPEDTGHSSFIGIASKSYDPSPPRIWGPLRWVVGQSRNVSYAHSQAAAG